MKKQRSGTQLKLTNPKNAGRKAIHDIGIRHIKRAELIRPSSLHLTIKLKKADIQKLKILSQTKEFRILKSLLDDLTLFKRELRFIVK